MLVLVLGVGIGLANGLIITKLRVNAFIATLGMALILGGIIENGWRRPATGVSDGFSEDLGYTRFGLIPMSFFLLAVVAVIVWFVLRAHALRLPRSTRSAAPRTSPSSRACARTARSSPRTSCAR